MPGHHLGVVNQRNDIAISNPDLTVRACAGASMRPDEWLEGDLMIEYERAELLSMMAHLRQKERIQPRAGRLDLLLLQDEESCR